MSANDLQEALKTIREAVYGDNLIWGTHRLTNRRVGDTMPIADPTEDTDAGRAEFARLLLWAWREFSDIEFQSGEVFVAEINYRDIYYKSGVATTPQEAFIRAFAAAIRARAEGGGE